MGLLSQLNLSIRLTRAAWRLTLRSPAALVVGLLHLLVLAVVVAVPAGVLVHLAFHDGARAWWVAENVLQLRFVTAPYRAGGWAAALPALAVWGIGAYALWITLVTFTSLFATTVIMHTGVARLRGERARLADGVRVATANAGRLMGFAFTTGLLLAAARRIVGLVSIVPLVGPFVTRGARIALTGVAYVGLPVLVYERKGPWAAVRDTWRHVRRTWGGLLAGTGLALVTVWGAACALALAVLVTVDAATGWGVDAWSTRVLVGLAAAIVLHALGLVLGAHLRAALYLHVTDGHESVLPENALALDPVAVNRERPLAVPTLRPR